jgi:hypothetical protein
MRSETDTESAAINPLIPAVACMRLAAGIPVALGFNAGSTRPGKLK